MSSFPELNDNGKFPAFYEDLTAKAAGTDIADAIDFSYVPLEGDHPTSFENKVRWLYAILFDKVHTTEGRNILYKYRHTRDGRRVLLELCQHASRSTAAVLRAGDIFAKLANSQLDSAWNCPYTDYISWFIRQVNLFNELCITPDDRLSDRMARAMLERAVSKARPLQNVCIRELEHMKSSGGPGWTLTQYVELLKDAAATMDRE